jgi:hypothetical protein
MCVVLITCHRDIFPHRLDFEIGNSAPGTETLPEQYKFRIKGRSVLRSRGLLEQIKTDDIHRWMVRTMCRSDEAGDPEGLGCTMNADSICIHNLITKLGFETSSTNLLDIFTMEQHIVEEHMT